MRERHIAPVDFAVLYFSLLLPLFLVMADFSLLPVCLLYLSKGKGREDKLRWDMDQLKEEPTGNL